ncbi:iron-siderophore ABC transporter substrate-binding protein [Nostoc sp. HG1]|nr:iron-siderophore ABC transporter substrate-binding protein [Nostoc sp. HG1]MCL6750033.1 iron-siderophore ABC transporter substrate-binding protein [Nostoc sp. CCCryo 231-06]
MKLLNKSFKKILLILLLVLVFVTACSQIFNYKINLSSEKIKVSDCRVVQHQWGKTCVPKNPQRLIVIDEDILETVLALGIKPLATGEPNMGSLKKNLLIDQPDEIISVGKQSQLNLEKILQLHPDLIIGFEIDPSIYQLFSKIAPTVSLEYSQSGWKIALQRMGEILQKSEIATQVLDQYEQRVSKLREALGEKLHKITVSVSQFYPEMQNLPEFRTKFSFPGSILKDIGLSFPKAQIQLTTNPKQTFISVNLERVGLLDADILFVALDTNSKSAYRSYYTNPLWQQLHVVQNKQVYTVDAVNWIFGNIFSANAILDDLFKYLINIQN